MEKSLPQKDLLLLSNFLNDQLSAQETADLKIRLQQDAQLKQQLIFLKETRYLLQHAKTHPVPRNFILTEEMIPAGKPAKLKLFNFFSFSSALATVLLVVILFVDLLPGFLQTSGLAKSSISEDRKTMQENFSLAEAVEEDRELPPQVFTWGMPEPKLMDTDHGGLTGMGGGEPAFGMGGAAPEFSIQPAEPSSQNESQFLKESEAEPIVGSGPILGIKSIEESAAHNQATISRSQEQSQDYSAALKTPFPWLRVSQIILAIIALCSAVLAFFYRKKRAC
jgi:hypothetical protein